MPYFVIRRGRQLHKEFSFPEAEILLIGRNWFSDIFLDDPSCRISRAHAAVIRLSGRQEQYLLRDLASADGTRINGKSIYQALLREGDVLQIGDYELAYTHRPQSGRNRVRIRIVPGSREESAGKISQSTIVPVLMERIKESPVDALKQEVLELVLRSRMRDPSPSALFQNIIGPAARSVNADRGFVGIFQDSGSYEEAGATGMSSDDQIEVADPTFLSRLIQGRAVHEGATVLAPILAPDRPVGFFCFDRRFSRNSFSDQDVEFLFMLGKFAAEQLGGEDDFQRDLATTNEIPVDWKLDFVGKCQIMQELHRQIIEAAFSDVHLFLHGESGAGKEVVAKAVHNRSPRRDKPFIARNCAALSETLAESEIFGYSPNSGIHNADPKGAPGWFELADGGTLFLDEIQGLSPSLQDIFLRVLQDKQVWRIGACYAAR